MINKWVKILLKSIGILLLTLFLLSVLIRLERVQKIITDLATNYLSDELSSRVTVGHIYTNFINNITLGDVYVEDLHNDTLLFVSQLKVQIRVASLFKKHINIKSIELNKPKIFVHRNIDEDDFNYQFIVDRFASKDTTKTAAPKIILNLKNAHITWMHLKYDDEKERNKFQTSFSKLTVTKTNYLSRNNKLEIDAVVLDDARIAFDKMPRFNFPADSLIPKTMEALEKIADTPGDSAAIPFSAVMKHLLINDARFSYDNHNIEQRCDGIDYNHVSVSNIKLFAENILFEGDSVKAQLQQISAQEQSGFKLNRLKADFLLNNRTMEFKNMIIETPDSYITDYYSMSYSSFTDFNDYLNNVVMRGNFRRAKVSVKDINYFARVLTPIEHNIVYIDGQVQGTVSRLRCRNLAIDAGKISRFNGNVDLTGLPNINETFISAKLDKVRTDIDDIQRFYPGIEFPKELQQLGLTRISGNFDGFIRDFVANAQIVTQIGVVNSDINLKFSDNYKDASYAGNLSAIDFDLGILLNENTLGRTTFNANVKGSGLTLKTLESEIKGTVQQFTFKEYAYSNIELDGKFTKSTFLGSAIAADPNLRLTFNGAIDMSDSIPEFDFQSNIEYVDLKKVNLTDENISFSTKLDLNFSGRNIDELTGLLDIKNTSIKKDDKEYKINVIQLESLLFEDEGTKKITFESDVLNAEARGKISFKDIGTTMQYFFHNYFKKNALELDFSKAAQYSQDFSFYVNINNDTKDLTELLNDNLKNIGQTLIEGTFNSERNILQLQANCQSVDYNKFQIRNFNANINGTPDKIFLSSAVDSLLYRDSLFTKNISLMASLNRDTINYSFSVQDSAHPNRVRLNGIVQSDLKSINSRFVKSNIWFNNDEWTIPDNNNIFYNRKILDISNLDLKRASHQLSIRTNIDNDSITHLIVLLNNMLMEDILNAVPQMKRFKVKGRADGRLTVLNVLQSPIPMATVTIDSLSINNQLMGLLTVNSNYNTVIEKIDLNATLKSDVNDVAIKGYYNIASKENNLLFDAQVKKLSLGWTEPFLLGVVSKTGGFANGALQLKGTDVKPVLTGKLNIESAHATVDFLNMGLSLKDEEVIFQENLIDLGAMNVYDNYGNIAYAKGKIKHSYFNSFFFDISANTDKFEMMNTTAAASSQFYGKAYGSAKILIKGPIDNIDFNIEATTLKNTKVSIAVSESKEVSQYSFYRFIQKDAEGVKKEKMYAKKVSGANFNINLIATPDAEVELVLSNNEGDIITAKGDGNLKISYDKYREMSIIGTYTVVEGEYLFSMQNVISKKFQIDKGSQIVWAGSPYDARLAINAIYRLRASPYDLIEDIVKSSNEKMQQARIRVLVNLILNIRGTITNPEISFDIKVPDADPAIKSALQSKLDYIRVEQNELNKQVVGLLVLNKFLPIYALGTTADNASSVATGASNTVSEFVTNQLSIYLSDWLSKFVTDVQLDIGYRTYQTDLSNGTGSGDNPEMENRRELQLALSKSFLNNRVFVDVGGNFDFGGNSSSGNNGTGQPTQRGNNVAGDFEVQYALTPDGRYKLKAFRRGEYDIFAERNRNKTGIGIQYKKEFDDWKDLKESVKRKSKKKKTDIPESE